MTLVPVVSEKRRLQALKGWCPRCLSGNTEVVFHAMDAGDQLGALRKCHDCKDADGNGKEFVTVPRSGSVFLVEEEV